MVASDWSGSANQPQYSSCEIQALSRQLAQSIEQQGAGSKKTCKKPTSKRVKIGNKNHVVYVGSRGGEYVKQKGEFITLKEALKK